MSIISKTSIKQIDPLVHKVYVDGEEIHKVTYLNFTAEPNSIPKVDITINSGFEFDGLAKVSGILEIENINSALRCIRFFCNLHEDVREQFVSKIKDYLPYDSDRLAEEIFDEILTTEFADGKDV